jgi:hypothetical protein
MNAMNRSYPDYAAVMYRISGNHKSISSPYCVSRVLTISSVRSVVPGNAAHHICQFHNRFRELVRNVLIVDSLGAAIPHTKHTRYHTAAFYCN